MSEPAKPSISDPHCLCPSEFLLMYTARISTFESSLQNDPVEVFLYQVPDHSALLQPPSRSRGASPGPARATPSIPSVPPGSVCVIVAEHHRIFFIFR